MREVIARWDERFLRRVFTDGEIAYCRARRDPVPHFAARFAAKEAALKALGTGLSLGVKWRELEVRRERGQAPSLVLSGRSQEIGRRRGGSHPLRVTVTPTGVMNRMMAQMTAPAATAAAASDRTCNVSLPR